jgi:serine/threonine kinase PknH
VDEVEFGRYQLIDVIGEGGMGKVYKAHDTLMHRDVAIKVLPPELATEPGYEERFRREAYTAARLTEPHIIPIFEAGEIDGRLYLVMPIIDGIDVHTLLRRDGPMSPQRAVQVIEQLAAALNAAHQHGLVHRDIKPSNALVTGDDFVYLIDFGIAHDSAATRLTSTGMMVGTLAYMAPERFMSGTADARSDVYALASVLHECLTGATPYPGDSMEQQIAGHLTLDPPRPSEHRPDIPAGLDDAIARGMAKNPDERYQSARELATAARRALTDAPRHTPHTAPVRHSSTQPVSVWQGPGHPTFAAAQPGPLGWPPIPQISPAGQPGPWPGPHPLPQQPAPRAKSKQWLVPGVVAAVVLVAVLVAASIYVAKQSGKTDDATRITTTSTASISTSTSRTTTAPTGPPPVAEGALQGLLLYPEQIDTAVGATGMTLAGPKYPTSTYDDSDKVDDKSCLPLEGPAQKQAYSGSGWRVLSGQELNGKPSTEHPQGIHQVEQEVVLFPSAREADAFFTASPKSWQACANRQFNFVIPGSGNPAEVWTVGPISNTDGTLSATRTIQPGHYLWRSCQRALTVANNVVIDVMACSYSRSDSQSNAAINIARQIAAKVPT